MTLTHTGFDAVVSDPGASEGYSEGWEELLGWYAAAVAAQAGRD